MLEEWADRIAAELAESAAGLLRTLARLLDEIGDELEGKHPHHRRHHHPHLPRFNPAGYTALPSARVAVDGVNLAAMSSAAMLISIENRGSLPPGSQYTFQVQQFVAGELVGGSVFVVRIAGLKVTEPFASPSLSGDLEAEEVEELEVEGVARRHLPPWMAGLVAQSEENLRKKTS